MSSIDHKSLAEACTGPLMTLLLRIRTMLSDYIPRT